MYVPVPQSYPSAHWKNWHCLFFLCLHVKKRRPLLGPTLSTTRMVHGNPWPSHSGNPTSADSNIVTTELFNWCNWRHGSQTWDGHKSVIYRRNKILVFCPTIWIFVRLYVCSCVHLFFHSFISFFFIHSFIRAFVSLSFLCLRTYFRLFGGFW